MEEKTARRGIQSVEVAFRLLTALQSTPRAMALKDIAALAGLTPSAANNYLVSLVRTGLAAADDRPGFYRLGPSLVGLGMAAIQQLDGFEVLRQQVIELRDSTRRNAAVTTWSEDGPISLFKQDGDQRSPFEIRTGLIGLLGTAAGKVFVAALPAEEIDHVLRSEAEAAGIDGNAFRIDAQKELQKRGYVVLQRLDGTGYVSMAAPIWDLNGQVRFAIGLIGSKSTLDTSANGSHARAILDSASHATKLLGGIAPR